MPQSAAVYLRRTPKAGHWLAGTVQRHSRAAMLRIVMRTLPASEVESIRACIPQEAPIRPSVRSHGLGALGERLRATYPTTEPLPVRLTELVDRLGRRIPRDR